MPAIVSGVIVSRVDISAVVQEYFLYSHFLSLDFHF